SWSSPIRTRSAAALSFANCPGVTSTACGSCTAAARLSTRTRSPPTASARARRSVEVVTTGSAPPAWWKRGAAPASRLAQAGTAASRARRAARTLRLLDEDGLRDHAVNALPHIHHLRHTTVAHHRDERVGLVAGQRHHLLAREEVHGLADGVHHRTVEVLVEAQHDPVRARLHARPVEFYVLAHDELHHDLPVGALERGEVDLAVALAAVGVARPDETASEEDRDEDGRAFLQLVDVHVGAVLPRAERGDGRHRVRGAALARGGVLRIDADGEDAGEGLELDHDAGLELGLALLPVEVEIPDEPVRHLGCQRPDGRKLLAGQVEVHAE